MPLPFAKSASQTRPTFSRDFAGLKTLDHGAGPSITFTRASNATYFDANGVLQTASNDVPRFDHDPATGASRGLLIEEARTNLFQRSAEFDNAYWNKVSTTITANNTTSPDETSSADLVEKTGNETTTPAVTLSVTAAAHTVSVFAKNSSGNRLRLRIDATGGTIVSAVFNTATGEVVSTDAGVTASVVNAGNGWYRCIATYTFASAVSASIGFSPRNEGADATGAKAWLWGAQLEAGAFPTSYIPTTTAAATRSADSAVVTPISSFYNQAEGTLFAECRQVVDSASQDQIAFVDDNTLGNRIGYICTTANKRVEGRVVATSVQQDAFASASNTTLGAPIIKVGLAYKVNDMAFATGFSSTVQTDSSATIPSSLTHLRLGENASGGRSAIHIRKIAYYPRRLSNTLLQQLTT